MVKFVLERLVPSSSDPAPQRWERGLQAHKRGRLADQPPSAIPGGCHVIGSIIVGNYPLEGPTPERQSVPR